MNFFKEKEKNGIIEKVFFQKERILSQQPYFVALVDVTRTPRLRQSLFF
jgi:hypothetical protein